MSPTILSFTDTAYMPFEDQLKRAIRKYGPESITDQHKASMLLQDMAWGAWQSLSLGARACRTGCRNTEHFHARPGAWIKMQSPEKRALLENLKSRDLANVVPPPVYRVGSKWNLEWGALETSPSTIWKLGKR